MKKNKAMLIVLDGVGVNKEYEGNAFFRAKTPYLDSLIKNKPYTTLGASEKYVGLEKKQLGSSEVGHTILGAGSVIESDIVRINKEIKNKTFEKNKTLLKAIKNKKSKIHLVGLLSDGGIHAHINHLFEILKVCKKYDLKEVYLHLFTDGRDTPPRSALDYIEKLKFFLHKINYIDNVYIASISGRFYGMDRDHRWKREKKIYDLLVYSKGNFELNPRAFIKYSYKRQITDEFLEPTLFYKQGTIKEKDTVLFFNFRSDRAREFTRMFTDNKFKPFKTKKLDLNFFTFTVYDNNLKNVNVIFPHKKPKDGLGQLISKKGYKQLRVAETEKFAHVTYFFNQGQEFPNKAEDRILVPSPKIDSYDNKPEMSANEITKKLINSLNKDYKFTLINFANGDMVGHTGNIAATIKGLEVVDKCVEKIVKAAKDTDIFIVADHGNCDEMIDEKGNIKTSHSLKKVPFIIISNKDIKLKQLKTASLSNVAPTILDVLNLKIPKYFDKSLLKK